MAEPSTKVRRAQRILRISWVLLGIWFAHLAWRLVRWVLGIAVPLGGTGLLASEYFPNTTVKEHWFIFGWLALEAIVLSLGLHIAVKWGKVLNQS